MKKIVIFALTALVASTMAMAQTPDAVYKLLRYEWTVNSDGTSDYHYRHEVTILRNRALTAYADKGETFVVYNPDMEELHVNEVYTLRADGSRVDMPQNAFVYQLPSNCADCGRFNHIRELAMVHTGMEIGCTIVVDYTIHRRYSLLSVMMPLVKDCPIERLEVSVKLPDNQQLNAELTDPKVLAFSPVVKATGNTYMLSANDVPQTFVDSYLPAANQMYPTLHFYNGSPDFEPPFNTQGLAEAGDVAGMVMSSGDAKENIASIRNFVVDNIHLNDLPPALVGYTHSTAADVWRTGCGTATDKAVLLAAMLNEMGFKARVVGQEMDQVGVTLDTLEYYLDVRSKKPLDLYGEAHDEVAQLNEKATVVPQFDTLVDGFYHLRLQPLKGEPKVRATQLALSRVAPLQSSACDLHSDITYPLPKGMKLVGEARNETLDIEGVGSMSVGIKQSGKKLRVQRSLKLEKSLIASSEYEGYRRLIALWQSFDQLLLRQK